MQKNKQHFIKKIVLVVGLLGIISVGSALYYSYHQQETGTILDFNEFRDAPFILDSFNRDWHWLIEGFDFSPERMLRERTSSKKNGYEEIIKVGYEGKKPTGFIIYHLKSFYLGKIHFIDVDPAFRSKGWSDKLLDYAIKDFIKRGVTKVELVTRTTNYPAQKLYTRYGFKEIKREDGFVNYEYRVPEGH
jgi:ribosomal protein S18 acetylase RimI-like enzyme